MRAGPEREALQANRGMTEAVLSKEALMSLLASLYTGVSGLMAQGQALGVIGDNIANAHSTGFKASRAEFSDIMAKNLKGVLGGNQIGRGAKLQSVNSIFT